MGVKEDPVIVTGFIVVNGDRLIFATDMKTYGYGLRQENFMKLEEICEHGFGLNATIFTPYSRYTSSLWSYGYAVKGWNHTIDVPQCVSSNLKEFHLGKRRGRNEELKLARYIMKNAMVLRTISIIVKSLGIDQLPIDAFVCKLRSCKNDLMPGV
ncbi:hypothetical protein K1719_039358 [Acacia pycnantha]|nr:hypothetical protein K1719_039358 [Acacia pycnantha]